MSLAVTRSEIECQIYRSSLVGGELVCNIFKRGDDGHVRVGRFDVPNAVKQAE